MSASNTHNFPKHSFVLSNVSAMPFELSWLSPGLSLVLFCLWEHRGRIIWLNLQIDVSQLWLSLIFFYEKV